MNINLLFCLLSFGLCFGAGAAGQDASAGVTHYLLSPNTTRVLYIADNNIDIDILVKKEGQLVSRQNGPETVQADEFVVLRSGDKPTRFELEIRPTHQSAFKPSWHIATLDPSDTGQHEADYRRLYQASVLWGRQDSQSKEQALAMLESRATGQGQQTGPYRYFVISYAAMLAGLDRFEQAYRLIELVGSRIGQAEWHFAYKMLWVQADASLMVDRRRRAARLYEKLTTMAVPQTDSEAIRIRQIQVLGDCGLAQILWGWFDSDDQSIERGLRLLDSAIVQASAVGDYLMMSNLLSHKWTYWAIHRDLDRGEKSLLVALHYARLSGLPSAELEILMNLAKKYQLDGQIGRSLDAYRQALVLVSTTTRIHTRANVLFGLAEDYRLLAAPRKAERFYRRALQTYQKGKVEYSIANVRRALGRLRRDAGDYEGAIGFHRQALAYFTEHSPEDSAKLWVALAKDYVQKGEFDEAQSWLDKAMSGQAKIRLAVERIDVALVAAEIALRQVNRQGFEQALAGLEGMQEKSLLPVQRLEKNTLLLQHHLRWQGVDSAQALLAQATEDIDRFRQSLDNPLLAQRWSARADRAIGQFVSAFMALAEQTGDSDLQAAVFSLIEHYHALNLRERRSRLVAEAQADGGEDGLDDQRLIGLWQSRLAAEKALVDAAEGQSRRAARMKLDDATEAYLTYLPTQKVKSTPLTFLDLEQLQARLHDNEAFVRYYLRDDVGFAFVVTAQQWQVLRLPSQALLAERIGRLHRQLYTQRLHPDGAVAELASLLPGTLLAGGRIERLIIQADGILSAVPFAAINLSFASGRYRPLVGNVDLIRVFSASEYFAAKASPQHDAGADIALFADPVFDRRQLTLVSGSVGGSPASHLRSWSDGLSRLKWTAVEAREVAAEFAGQRVLLALGNEATNAALMSRQMRTAGILHIATHGYFDAAVPEVVGLATSVIDGARHQAPGFLTLTELLSKPFYSRLVVISGCETMLGELIDGEGFNSLSRGVLSQGAGSVISTLWSIPDRPTAEFMRVLYRQLKRADGNAAIALNRTKRQFARAGRYRHPLYWAGFVYTAASRGFEQAINW